MYKVVWINNIMADYPARQLRVQPSPMGGWLMAMAKSVNRLFEIILVAPGPVNDMQRFKDDEFIYYVLPEKKMREGSELYWNVIYDEVQPDIFHINGTELGYANYVFEKFTNTKKIISIQGLVSECSKYYYANLSFKEIYINVTFKDVVRNNSIIAMKKRMVKRGKEEIKSLKLCDRIIGRTDWDYSVCLRYGLENKYRIVNENLRDIFYSKSWDVNRCIRHTIFCSQGAVPYKGIHVLFEAVYILKKQFRDIKVYIAGYNLLKHDSLKDKIKLSGYSKYLTKKIKEYGIEENITFTGLLNEEEMCDYYLKSNVVVQTSFIENSSNSLGEAMALGAPVVASFVGGTGKYVEHKKNALVYPSGDSNMLAYYIKQVFEDDEMAQSLGHNANKNKQSFYNREKNALDLENVYMELI